MIIDTPWMPNVLGGGDVAGPASATDNAVARFDGTTGKLIQNSVVTISDTNGDIAGARSLTSPASSPLTLGTGTSGAAVTVLSASNNVGIGTITPLARFELAGTSANTDFRISRTVSPSTYLSVTAPGGSPSTSVFGISGTDVMSLNSTSVTIANTTAGSSGAGALVVQGGLATGAASYFGGAVTAQGDVSVTRTGGAREVRIATTTSGAAGFYAQGYSSATIVGGTAGGELVLWNQDATANAFSAVTNLDAAGNTTSRIRFINESDANNTGSIAFATRPSGGSLTDALTLASTGAATFAGAVSVSGTAATWTSGTGSPESVKTAPVGSLYTRTDGGASTTLYVKESGASNTGWIAK